MIRKILLTSGVLSSLLYVAMTVLVAVHCEIEAARCTVMVGVVTSAAPAKSDTGFNTRCTRCVWRAT
jgi:hypothetical protein